MLDLDLVQKNLDSVKIVYKKLNEKYELYNGYHEEITEKGTINIRFNDLFITREEVITDKLLNVKKNYHYNDIDIFLYTFKASDSITATPISFNYNIIECNTKRIIKYDNYIYDYKDVDRIISFIDKVKDVSMKTFITNTDVKDIISQYIEENKLTKIRTNKLLRYFNKCDYNLSIYNLYDITKNIPINYTIKYNIINKLFYALGHEISSQLTE